MSVLRRRHSTPRKSCPVVVCMPARGARSASLPSRAARQAETTALTGSPARSISTQPEQAQRRSNLGSSQCGTLLSASTTQAAVRSHAPQRKGRAAPVDERHAVDGFSGAVAAAAGVVRAGQFLRRAQRTVAQAHQRRAAPDEQFLFPGHVRHLPHRQFQRGHVARKPRLVHGAGIEEIEGEVPARLHAPVHAQMGDVGGIDRREDAPCAPAPMRTRRPAHPRWPRREGRGRSAPRPARQGMRPKPPAASRGGRAPIRPRPLPAPPATVPAGRSGR